MKKLQRELRRVADEYGFTFVGLTAGDHLKFRHLTTGDLVFHSSTPSDMKSINALRAQFKKINEGRVPTDPAQQKRRGKRGTRK